ncbi:hypothetical protein LGM90_27620, partial [Burkholderia sp. AU28942]|uniref:hypothetical protein n=1 Tax=Burkholderia sp. AU28942 TaxID=2879626 RepID=UPI001CF5AA5E
NMPTVITSVSPAQRLSRAFNHVGQNSMKTTASGGSVLRGHQQAEHHVHIILLPLLDGRMVGSDLVGYKPRYREVESDFSHKVLSPLRIDSGARSEPYGYGERQEAAKQLVETLQRHPQRMSEPAVKQILRNALGPHVDALNKALGAPKARAVKNDKRSFAEIMCQPMDEQGRPLKKRPSVHRSVTLH